MKEDPLISRMKNRPYFFDKGIRFECLRCGGCCTGEPGIVYADRMELEQIAMYLEIPFDVLEERFTNAFLNGYTIREVDDGRCIFYENGCVIYPVRPLQCSTFPFWFQNMRSPKAWKETCQRCPGIGRGTLFTKEEILERVAESYPVFIKVMEGSIRL
jgi:Fe-S-cluster containining protein